MASKKKIMVIIPPATGHINPMCGVVAEICKQEDTEVIFYSDEQFREGIEKTGAKFRPYVKPLFTRVTHKTLDDKQSAVAFIANHMITFAHDLLPQLIGDVEQEKPDLIFYDSLFTPGKYLIELLRNRHRKGQLGFNMPKTAMFVPNFVFNQKTVKIMNGGEKKGFDLGEFFWLIYVVIRQFVLNLTFGLSWSTWNPLLVIARMDNKLNIVGVAEELQPFREDFDSAFKFVGPCIVEQVRSYEIKNDDELKRFLEKSDDSKLIYMSLGTIFNVNIFVFERVIEAIRTYDAAEANRRFKSSQFKVIISVGEMGFKSLSEKAKSGELRIPENVLLRAQVPQLEVLKRADLFITHSGMNSINETIKYAVPILAMPCSADQPLVAHRCCDELGMGVKLNTLSAKANEIADSIDLVLSEDKYRNKVQELSKLAMKYNGPVEAAKLIGDYLNQKEGQQKKSD